MRSVCGLDISAAASLTGVTARRSSARGDIFLTIIVRAPASLSSQIGRRGWNGDRKKRSNRHTVAVEFVVLIVAAVAGAQVGKVMNEFDRDDPFDHLEAELVLAAQPQRRARTLTGSPFIS